MNTDRHRWLRTWRSLAAVLVLAVLTGCNSSNKKPVAPPSLADRITEAHGRDAWYGQKALSGRLVVAFKDAPLMDLRFLHDIRSGRTRMDLADGTKLLWDGQRAWVSPSNSPFKMARFHLLTWPYFMALPYKLHDPGVKLTEPEERQLSGRTYISTKLTFAPNIGDTPDDWYVLYADPQSGRLEAAAYIVTYGKTRAQAEEEPHAITFYDYWRGDGVQIAQEWRFWKWNNTVGLFGEPLGQARLANLEFIPTKQGMFDKPPDAREDVLP